MMSIQFFTIWKTLPDSDKYYTTHEYIELRQYYKKKGTRFIRNADNAKREM